VGGRRPPQLERDAKPSPLFARVRALVRAIPRGRVATYGQLSKLIDGRLTPVGIGWALHGCDARIPWHRVINARGGISTEGAHPGLQRDLLAAEGIRFRADDTVDVEKYRWAGPSRRAPRRPGR
jgi:methylated-DNA-protein-cysteine methyltransferase-like protein